MSEITHAKFEIAVPDAELADLAERLDRVRFPNAVDESDATGGTAVASMRDLISYWRDGFDWRAREAELNRLDHRIARIGGLDVHYFRVAAEGEARVPVVLLHGWPDSFFRYHHLAPLLAAAGHEVVVPSLPGFTFGEQPSGQISVEPIAELVHVLMGELGHTRYAAHGGDWGSAVAEQLAVANPRAVAALHLSDVPYQHLFDRDRS